MCTQIINPKSIEKKREIEYAYVNNTCAYTFCLLLSWKHKYNTNIETKEKQKTSDSICKQAFVCDLKVREYECRTIAIPVAILQQQQQQQ